MRTRNLSVLIGSALAAVACSGGGSGGEMNRFVEGCNASTNLGKDFCECAGKNAREEMSDDAFTFLAASFDGDEQELAKLRDNLGMADAMEAGMFMINAYKKCDPDE